MKIGQMASYVDDGLSPGVRRTLSRLQDSVPPMSAELAAGVVEAELGMAPERAFAQWDPEPIAAASIGQVHRAITHDGQAVAVKVQYPGIAEAIAADLDNVALLRRMLRITAPAQDVDALLAELQGAGARGARLPARGGEPGPGRQLLRRPSDDQRPEGHRRAVDQAGGDQRAGRRRPVRRARPVAAGRARPGRRDDLPVRLPEPVRGARLQRRSAPGELPVPRRRPGHLPGLRAGQALHRRTSCTR